MKHALIPVSALAVVGMALAVLVPPTLARSDKEGQLKTGDSQALHDVAMDCLSVKLKLGKVHEDDGLLRVNLGQKYDYVSTKLMAKLNSRIVQNRVDGGELIKKAAEYETALNNFKSHYQDYEVAMNGLIKSECSGRPLDFYRQLQTVRDLRTTVEGDVKQLNRLISEYHQAFEAFYAQTSERRDND